MKNLKNIIEQSKNPLFMFLSAGIIKPEHNYSGPADLAVIKKLSEGAIDTSLKNWKDDYSEIFLGNYNGDWIAMDQALIKKVTGKEYTRGQIIQEYINQVVPLIKNDTNSIVSGVQESLKLINGYNGKISLLSGQETVIINQFYLRDKDNLEEFIDPAYVQGGIIPSTPENVAERAYGIIQTLNQTKNPIDTLILLDENKERIKNAGTEVWKTDLGINQVLKIGINDSWISKKLDKVTDFQYKKMIEFYNAIK